MMSARRGFSCCAKTSISRNRDRPPRRRDRGVPNVVGRSPHIYCGSRRGVGWVKPAVIWSRMRFGLSVDGTRGAVRSRAVSHRAGACPGCPSRSEGCLGSKCTFYGLPVTQWRLGPPGPAGKTADRSNASFDAHTGRSRFAATGQPRELVPALANRPFYHPRAAAPVQAISPTAAKCAVPGGLVDEPAVKQQKAAVLCRAGGGGMHMFQALKPSCRSSCSTRSDERLVDRTGRPVNRRDDFAPLW